MDLRGVISLALVLGLSFAGQAAEFAYEQVDAAGPNGEIDYSVGSCSEAGGCRAKGGLACASGAICDLATVPEGRCAAGALATGCIWPDGAGRCVSDAAVGCLPDAPADRTETTGSFASDVFCGDLASNLCDMATNDVSCECTGTLAADPSYEGFVCGVGDLYARCSDGDPDLAIGGQERGQCTTIGFVGGVVLAPNCGNNSDTPGATTGPRFDIENPRRATTTQRRPGQGLGTPLSRGPILERRTTQAFDLEDPGAGTYSGVRLVRAHADSYWSDPAFSAGTLTGGLDAISLALRCDAPEGWTVNLPISGTCTDGITFCIEDGDCNIADTCDPQTFEYCWEFGSDGYGALWERDLTDQEAAGQACPPACGSNVDLNTGEFEGLRAVAAQNPRAASQLALDNYSGPRQGQGGLNLVQPTYLHTWINEGDLRCFVGGRPAVVDSLCGDGGPMLCGDGVTPCDAADDCATKIGRCNDASGQACDVAIGGASECQAGAECLPCGGTLDGSPCVDCAFTDAARGTPGAFPVGYNDHGFAALDLSGRLGLLNDIPSTLRIPVVLAMSNGAQRSEFRDDTCAGEDGCELGEDAGPLLSGIGSGGSFAASFVPPVDPSGGTLGQAVNWQAAGSGGQAQGGPSIQTVVDRGAGADAIPGCIGDNEVGDTPCGSILGGASAGSTGADDSVLLSDWSALQDGSDMRSAVRARNLVAEPSRPAPVLHMSYAVTSRDHDLLGMVANTDLMAKAWETWCPLTGSCSDDSSVCNRDGDCVSGDCQDMQRNCTPDLADACANQGGDADGDGICQDVDPCLITFNATDLAGEFFDINQDGVPDECQCGDPNGTGAYESADLLASFTCLSNDSTAQFEPCATRILRGDSNNTGAYESADLLRIFSALQNPTNSWQLTCPVRPEGTDPGAL